MKSENLQIGYLVQSVKGRDKNSVYVILTKPNQKFLRLVNGNNKKLINPKLKNINHIIPLNLKLDKIKQKLEENKKVFDSEIYSAIKKKLEQENSGGKQIV